MYDTLRFRADAQHSSSQKVVNSFLPSRPLPSPWSGEEEAFNEEEMLEIIDFGHSERTTHSTAANDSSSRSHAIC